MHANQGSLSWPTPSPRAHHREVVNTGSAGIHITTVDVEIRSIAVKQHSAKGPCDPTDYTLLDRRMTVNRTLGVGQSAAFSGASIGSKNKPRTQDACQNATVHLHYLAHTSRQ
ncbi:hypothetical protein [Paeniglutamicibacter sp.]|uniref:hypothetical protein n=1 Tax=Paeniglutamicibacter sp. TaxID=1934391 RepID=UPI003988C0CE